MHHNSFCDYVHDALQYFCDDGMMFNYNLEMYIMIIALFKKNILKHFFTNFLLQLLRDLRF